MKTGDGVKAGDEIPVRTLVITAPPMRILARILADPNPIHLDPQAVKIAGLGERVINPGPANLAYVIDTLTHAFPRHRLRDLKSRYTANVFDGQTVQAGGTIKSIEGETLHCEAWLKIIDGSTALTVTATLLPR